MINNLKKSILVYSIKCINEINVIDVYYIDGNDESWTLNFY